MNELKIFNNREFGEVRISLLNNEAYFMLADVCRVLEIKNSRQAKARLKGDGVITTDIIDNLGREQQADFINESNLYKLVFQSRKPQAEKFSEWVTSEVLPSIRKHGAYMTDDTLEKALTSPDFLIELATKLKEEKEKNKTLKVENKIKEQQIAELKPKADYTDRILNSKSLVTISQIAKDYGMSGTALNDKLHELKVQYKQSGQWLLYAKYQDKGYTHSETTDLRQITGIDKVIMHTKWTQKGRLFLYDMLKKNGILPVIERN